MKNYKFIFVAFLIGVTIISVFKYISFLKEKTILLNELEQIKSQVTALETEKQNIAQALDKTEQGLKQKEHLVLKLKEENAGIKGKFIETRHKIARVEAEFKQAQKNIAELNSAMTALREQKDNLSAQIAEISQERDNLALRLSSLVEPKKAIRELKKQARKVNTEIKHKARLKEITDGNRGFLIKDGKSTYAAKIKIEVMPAAKNE
jgi:chromosome segregation ATPase